MEEVLVVLIQFLFEVVFNAIVSQPFSWFMGWREVEGDGPSCLVPVVFMIVGGVVAWLSLLILPKLLIPLVFLRVINLIFAPVFAGGLSAYLATLRDKQATRVQVRRQFMNTFLFTLAFVAVRWAYSQ